MPLYLYQEFNGFPAGTEITDYVTSQDLFNPDNKTYIATIKGEEYVIPPEYTTMFKPEPEPKKRFNKIKALELIKDAEKMLYDKWMLTEENDLKIFLEENSVTVNHEPRKCIDCGVVSTNGMYCNKCTWSHEPGY